MAAGFDPRQPRDGRTGRFTDRQNKVPEVALPPHLAEPDPGMTASLHGLADDLLEGEGASPLSGDRARVHSVAFFASEVSRSCIRAAQKQVLATRGLPGQAVTTALAAVNPLPRKVMDAGEDIDSAREAVLAARASLAVAAAGMPASDHGVLKIIDGRLASMAAFLEPEAA